MKLDPTVFRYITKEEFRIMTAIEMGMRNHEFVPVPLIESIAKLTRGGTYKILANLSRHKLIARETKGYEGYRLTYPGYDFLALRALAARGTIVEAGRRLGVGKESDVHFCNGPNGEKYALKLHRLGRISFRAIKQKRDYLQHRSHGSWMYMARLAAAKEFAYMKALYDAGFPTPVPIDQNRHCVVMSLIDATPMYTIKDMPRAKMVLERLMRLLIRLARAGIVHSDFNEFNLLIGAEQKITLIDFPQVVHLNHPNAREFFDRDVKSICEYFRKKCELNVEKFPSFDEVLAEVEADGGSVMKHLNVQGISKEDDALLIAAHGRVSDIADLADEEDDADDCEDDDGDEDEQTGEVDDGGFAALVPEGGQGELADPDDEIDGEHLQNCSVAVDTELASKNEAPPSVEGSKEKTDASDDDDSDGESSEASEGPGEVAVCTAKKVRKKTNAKEARKNIQRQQKKPPAKANKQKDKKLREGREAVKDYLA